MISDDAANAEYRRQASLNSEDKLLVTFVADIVMGMVLTMSIAIVEWFFGFFVLWVMVFGHAKVSQFGWYSFWFTMMGVPPIIVSLIGIKKERRGLVCGALIWAASSFFLLIRISWS